MVHTVTSTAIMRADATMRVLLVDFVTREAPATLINMMANVDCVIAREIYVTVSKDANRKMEDALVCIVAQALSASSIANLQTGVL